ncbi:hypothetical protein K458DRAFT_444627 [Lentithecium fluviatile CBS 122367]|uniref:MFS general substrate transporter n=1 Tax=Lentithecium fluviatile CBS 122367 TaxID=1168545 RepID=A0A6G1IU75_9PLEO|nr:hypothetical protein K458DRAFT_444627 [Lentithecium fluviatile CBS 122367]
MMLSLCKSYWHFMLVQGVLMDASMSLLQFPAMTGVSQYFDKKRASALGLVIAGSSIGGSDIGFAWSVRVTGFVAMPCMAFACPVRFTNCSPVFHVMGMFTPLFFIPTYTGYHRADPTLVSYLLAILNAASTFGRIIPGVLADKYGRLNIFALGGIFSHASGIIILCLDNANSTAGGAIISGTSAAFSIYVPDVRDFGTWMGQDLRLLHFSVT